MLGLNLLVFNVIITSIFEIYIMVQYLRNTKYGRFFQTLITYTIIISLLFYVFYSKLNILNFTIICSLITIVIGNEYIGEYLDYYHKSKHYDRYLHLFGAFSFSLLTFSILNATIKPIITNWVYIFVIVFTLGITIGVFFEISEFIHDSIAKKDLNQHGQRDTDFDLIFDTFGSLIAAIFSIYIF